MLRIPVAPAVPAGGAAVAPLAAGDPHVLRPDLFQRQQLQIVLARELRISSGVMRTPLQVSYCSRMRRQAVQLAAQNAARLQHAPRFAQVVEHHLAAGNVLEDGVGVDEVELVVRKLAQVRTPTLW